MVNWSKKCQQIIIKTRKKFNYRSRALRSRSKLRAATGLRAALENFLLHENIFTVTFVEKGSYVRGYGIYAQLPHSFELISQTTLTSLIKGHARLFFSRKKNPVYPLIFM